ncbi:MAG TPA: hypothetical protein VG104_08725 [Candidatus Dormibacteraeota bacterium]|nr:hypothetical protein [Candidatus Dormibacteraeota bacterium]
MPVEQRAGDRADGNAGGNGEEDGDPGEGRRMVSLQHEQDQRQLGHLGRGAPH